METSWNWRPFLVSPCYGPIKCLYSPLIFKVIWLMLWPSQVELVVETNKQTNTMQVQFMGQEDLLEEEVATGSSILSGKLYRQRSLVEVHFREQQRVPQSWMWIQTHTTRGFLCCHLSSFIHLGYIGFYIMKMSTFFLQSLASLLGKYFPSDASRCLLSF